MALKYDMNAIFEDLEKIAMEKIQKKANEKKKEEPPDKKVESPEDAESTEVVVPATSKISELVHGGDESSKEIENSKNVADDGENERDSKLKNNDENLKEEKDNAKEQEKNEENDKSESDENEVQGEKENTIVGEEEKSNYNGTSEENENDIFKKQIEQMFVRKSNEIEELKENNKPEYIKKQVIEIIKKIADMHSGIDVQDGSERYDKRKMIMHMLKGQNYKLMNDKSDLMDARYVQFFIDTSGVYGCGSNKIMHELIPEIIRTVEALQISDCADASTPANWQPGVPVIISPPQTFSELQQRLEDIKKNCNGISWYLSFKEPSQKCLNDINIEKNC